MRLGVTIPKGLGWTRHRYMHFPMGSRALINHDGISSFSAFWKIWFAMSFGNVISRLCGHIERRELTFLSSPRLLSNPIRMIQFTTLLLYVYFLKKGSRSRLYAFVLISQACSFRLKIDAKESVRQKNLSNSRRIRDHVWPISWLFSRRRRESAIGLLKRQMFNSKSTFLCSLLGVRKNLPKGHRRGLPQKHIKVAKRPRKVHFDISPHWHLTSWYLTRTQSDSSWQISRPKFTVRLPHENLASNGLEPTYSSGKWWSSFGP